MRLRWWMLTFALAAVAQNGRADEPKYGEATAHDPHYDDRTLWPAWVEKADFAKEQWPKARLLVWAHAGKSMRGVDASDPANWLEDGRPARKGPDENTDVVFVPWADGKRTFVAGDKGCAVRHMTVEAGVGAHLKTVAVHGNQWIKRGGSFHQTHPGGARDTFMRNDTPEPNNVANKITLNKPPEKSIEWIGNWKIGDELDLFSGIFIVAPDSTFLPGDRSTQHIYPDAKLVLLSGSAFYKRSNQYWGHDVEVVGEILAGTADRPLTKDAVLGLSFKAKGKARGHVNRGPFISHMTNEGDKALILYKQGRIAVHSADPATARLVIQWRGFGEGRPNKEAEPPDVAAMPHGIDMILLGETRFDGVRFDHVLKGGVEMPDPSARAAWKNVSFGEGNFAPQDELFAKYTGSLDIRMKDTGVAAPLVRRLREAAEEGSEEDEP